MKNKKKNKGFTLIELVIVIAIIAILISIAAMRYSSTNLAAEAAANILSFFEGNPVNVVNK